MTGLRSSATSSCFQSRPCSRSTSSRGRAAPNGFARGFGGPAGGSASGSGSAGADFRSSSRASAPTA